MVAEVLTKGTATFPDGKVLDVAPRDWLEFAKWAYGHIDGPPKQAVELTGADGGPIQHEEVGLNAEQRDRAMSALADTLAVLIHRVGASGPGDVGTAE